MSRPLFSRSQRTTIVYGILCLVLAIVILQLWLLTATMHAFLGGEGALALPAALVSLLCLGLNFGLLRYIHGLDKNISEPGDRAERAGR
jgi:hypothetical protein